MKDLKVRDLALMVRTFHQMFHVYDGLGLPPAMSLAAIHGAIATLDDVILSQGIIPADPDDDELSALLFDLMSAWQGEAEQAPVGEGIPDSTPGFYL